MKNSAFYSTATVIAIILLFGFVANNRKTSPKPTDKNQVIDCGPAPQTTNAILFTPDPNPPAVMVRKNIYSLTPAQITSLKTGITNMKALNYTNPTSWEYQAAIHGTTRPDNLQSWNTCHQVGFSFFFLAWHRMYCYYFERILRAKSGDPNLTLPYWDYQTNATLHPDYRNNAPGNPLYDGSRNGTMNTGGSLPASISTSINTSLTELLFYNFQTGLNPPHGSVHISMGGNMTNPLSAAKDPVFWLHHCNIDRLWEVWLRKCQGRINPSDAQFMNKSYTFFNENGTAISMTGSQVVATATQLSYKYDFPLINPCLIIKRKWYIYERFPLIKWPIAYTINTKLLKRSFKEAKPETLDNFVKSRNKQRFDFAGEEVPDRLVIELENIRVDKLPEGVVEVYLNLPANEEPSPKSKSFVGLLDLFAISHANKHAMMKNMVKENSMELNATEAAQALGLSISDLKNADISFFVRGNSMQGREKVTEANVRVEGINLAIEMANKNKFIER